MSLTCLTGFPGTSDQEIAESTEALGFKVHFQVFFFMAPKLFSVGGRVLHQGQGKLLAGAAAATSVTV